MPFSPPTRNRARTSTPRSCCPNGVAVFARDIPSSRAVWSADDGYPGDFSYREFYRDIGFDLPLDYIGPYVHEGAIPHQYRVQVLRNPAKTDDKKPYDPEAARRKAEEHAENFLYNRLKQVKKLSTLMDRPPIIVSPYDAELFGHWWFEGPQWIEFLLRKIDVATSKGKAHDGHRKRLSRIDIPTTRSRSPPSRAGGTRDTPKSGSTEATTGSIATFTRRSIE